MAPASGSTGMTSFDCPDLPVCGMRQGTPQQILEVKQGVKFYFVVNGPAKRLFKLQSGWQPS
jgi:hypothetical protein